MNPLYLDRRVGKKGRNIAAAALSIELPAMVAAFNQVTVEGSVRKRHGSVGTMIIENEDLPLLVPADDERLIEQNLADHLPALEPRGGHDRVPEISQHHRRCLPLGH
jgi:hypothetical protein